MCYPPIKNVIYNNQSGVYWSGIPVDDEFNGPGTNSDTVSYANTSADSIVIDLAIANASTAAVWTGSAQGGWDKFIGILNLTGSPGNDQLVGDANDNILDGGPGRGYYTGSSVYSGFGVDILDGRGGIDTASYASATDPQGVRVDLGQGLQDTRHTPAPLGGAGGAGWDWLISIENLTGSRFADELIGNSGDNVIDPGVKANFGEMDILDGREGKNTVSFASIDRPYQDLWLSPQDSTGVQLSLGTTSIQWSGAAGYIIVSNFENIFGSAFNDTFEGTGGRNLITGCKGDDLINGLGDIDTLEGEGGNDTLLGGAGGDHIHGGSGNDSIGGGLGGDMMNGGEDNDTITGGAAADTIDGGEGNDTIAGGSGFDRITGGEGCDTMTGGGGADQFNYTSIATLAAQTGITIVTADLINDFSTAQGDTVCTGTAGTAANYGEGVAAANFALALAAANSSFGSNPGEIYYLTQSIADSGVGLLFVDTNNDDFANAVIRLTGVTAFNFDFAQIAA